MLRLYNTIRRIAYACALAGIALTVLSRTGLLSDPRAAQAGYLLILVTFCLFFLSYGLIMAIRLKK